ncbi:uncharacterized protein DS421_13g418150 [Arachis hypogaea]|nr:uncharacterized protein DS421_13g418150 [Arachis hypogaea]
MAYPGKVREWFKTNPHNQKISNPKTASFLNQKAQIQAALAASQSKESIKGKLQQILRLLQEDEESSSKEGGDEQDQDKRSDEDCFEVCLGGD